VSDPPRARDSIVSGRSAGGQGSAEPEEGGSRGGPPSRGSHGSVGRDQRFSSLSGSTAAAMSRSPQPGSSGQVVGS